MPHESAEISMITLTRLDGERFILNAELIEYIEQRPDTFVTLTTGERLVVGETMDEVMRRAVDYQRNKHLIPPVCMPPLAAGGTHDSEES
jgi:flagellar protein FlbD